MCVVDHKVVLKTRCFLLSSRQSISKLAIYVFTSHIRVLNLAIRVLAIHSHFCSGEKLQR